MDFSVLLRRVLLLTVGFIGASASQADGELASTWRIAPTPEWVVHAEVPDGPSGLDAMHGTRYLLVGRHHYEDADKTAVSHRLVTKVVGQAGLSDNAKLSVTYDPGYQSLELHAATLTRNGQNLERLAEARIDVARTESDTDRDLLHGDATALVVLPDVRVGDTVEYRYTVYGTNPVFDDEHHSRWRMQWGVPVERSSVRITTPTQVQLQYNSVPDAQFSESFEGGRRSLTWQRDRIEAVASEEHVPTWHSQYDGLEVTAYRNWEEVAQWGAELFSGHSKHGQRYRELSRSIQQVRDTRGIDEAIAMAIDHVQKNIRYFGLELGENSHRPHSPDTVLRNGYGDCKDKATLLIALLDDIGVKAWPLLVSSRQKHAITERLPGPGVFDHVVVLVEHNDKEYWVDATVSHQAGVLGFRGQPEYGAGLVLGRPSQAMVTRDAAIPALPTVSAHDQFYLSATGGPTDLAAAVVYRGQAANSLRAYLDRSGKKRFRNWLHERVEELYGDAEIVSPAVIVNDDRRNEFSVSASYRLNKLWTVSRGRSVAEFDTYATVIYDNLEEFDDIDRRRRAPIALNGPDRVEHRLQFYPNIASSERRLEETVIDSEDHYYRDSEYVLGDSLVFDAELVIKDDVMDRRDYGDYESFSERVRNNASFGRYLRSVNHDDLKLGVATTELLDALGRIE